MTWAGAPTAQRRSRRCRARSLPDLQRQHARERRGERRPAAVSHALRLAIVQQRVDQTRSAQLLNALLIAARKPSIAAITFVLKSRSPAARAVVCSAATLVLRASAR